LTNSRIIIPSLNILTNYFGQDFYIMSSCHWDGLYYLIYVIFTWTSIQKLIFVRRMKASHYYLILAILRKIIPEQKIFNLLKL